MKMRPRCAASRADSADPLPTHDGIPQFHVDAGKMQESAAETMAMVDHQQPPFQREGAIGSQYDHAIGGRDDRLSGCSGYINAAMIGARHALIDALRSEQT